MLQNTKALAPLFAHLLQQTQKLQAAGCPGAAGIFSFPYSHLLIFPPDFLGVPKQREGSGLSTTALEAAAGQSASSSSVTPTDKFHLTLRDHLVTRAGLSCLRGQDSSEAPGTFLTAPSSRQNRLRGERNPSMVLSSRVLNVRAQEQPALLRSPQVVPAHPAGKAEGCSAVRKVPDIPELLSSLWATSAPGRLSPFDHRSKQASAILRTEKETVTSAQTDQPV